MVLRFILFYFIFLATACKMAVVPIQLAVHAVQISLLLVEKWQ